MPPPNVANKTKKAAEKKGNNANLSHGLARRKSQDFKSKIAAWDAQGQDEVVVVHDEPQVEEEVVVEEEEEEIEVVAEEVEGHAEDAPATPKTPGTAKKAPTKNAAEVKTSREISAGRKAWVRRRSKPAVEDKSPAEVTPEVKKQVAPKKRVVSDGHWRRDRPPKLATPEKEEKKDEAQKPVTVRRSVMNGVGLKFPPSVQDFVEEPDPQPVRRRHLKAPSRSRSRSREHDRVEAPDYESGGTKVYIKRKRRSKEGGSKAFSTSESSITAGSSFDRPSTATDITTPEDTPTKVPPARPRSEPRDRASRKSLEKPLKSSPRDAPPSDEQPRRVSRTKAKDDHDMPKPLKISNAGKTTPKIPAAPKQPNTMPKVFSARIDGWLSGMNDDPFTEASERSLTPEPLEIRRKKSRPSREAENDYDVNRREEITARKRSKTSLDHAHNPSDRTQLPSGGRTPVDDWVHSVSPDTPTLKRRGARKNMHSPIKNREEHSHFDDESLVSNLPRTHSRRRAMTAAYDKPSRPPPTRPRGRAPSIVSEQPTIMEGSVLSRASDGDSPVRRHGSGLKRRLTKHSDMMSVLSVSRDDADAQTKPSRRSTTRSRRAALGVATIGELMNEVSADELEYQRELRTLVDGVIPVLLTYVLSKHGAKPGHTSAESNPELTKPIVDMGVALERLKTQHKRIPMHDPNELLTWAQSTAKVYDDYLQAWRLGFSDVVVNLASAETPSSIQEKPARWDHDLRRNENGDMLNNEGERVGVAYLLKRPLVRLKYLQKTFKDLDNMRPTEIAAEVKARYENLVLKAKQRTNDERARLEDESAAAIDPTPARDPHSLAPLSGVNIDPSRSVRARDYFDLQLYHSSGQQLICKVELIVRDDAPTRGSSGDVLFCEVATNGRWLLFPPVLSSRVSARKGDKQGEIIVMIRGMLSDGHEWREILSLQSNEEQCEEWLGMLASDPKPPRIDRQSSFNTHRGLSAGRQQRALSPTESEVPFGERWTRGAQEWDGSEVNSSVGEIPPSKSPRARYHGHGHGNGSSPLARKLSSIRDSESGVDDRYRPRAGHSRSKSEWTATTASDRGAKKSYSVWMPSSQPGSDDGSDSEEGSPPKPQRPGLQSRTSSVPSMELPTIRKQRRASPLDTPKASVNTRDNPTSAPSKLEERRRNSRQDRNESTPEKKKSSSFGLKGISVPSFTPAFMNKRRSSSPLKHEYEPSTATESTYESEYSDDSRDYDSVTSDEDDFNEEGRDEGASVVGDLQDFGKYGTVRRSRPASRSNQSNYSRDGGSLGPDDSASQGVYRGSGQQRPPTATKCVANILSWSNDSGAWTNLHPEECEIVVSPGMIEAFDLAQAHAVAPNSGDVNEPSPSQRGVKPLVALEVTPLVQIRRGTAIDISVRAQPTANSLIRNSNNIMFRSKMPEDCEKMYQLINRARIDNPTFIALEQARGPVRTSNWAAEMDRRNAARTAGNKSPSWLKTLSRKSTSYRSKGNGNRSASIAASQSSVNSMSSAFAALRRFSGGSKIFDIAKSTIHSRKDGFTKSTRTGSDSLSSGMATPVLPFDPSMGTPLGVTNTPMKLHLRAGPNEWRDLGAARLTVLIPPRPAHDPNVPADPRVAGLEKRIIVTGKRHGNVLLDATLGESCFERIQRTGIAVSIWEDGAVPLTGGVAGARTRVFLLQMNTEREAAYTFSQVGKMRY